MSHSLDTLRGGKTEEEKREKDWERLSWARKGGREAPREKEIWEKVGMTMPKYRNTEHVWGRE